MTLDETIQKIKQQVAVGLNNGEEGSFQLTLSEGKVFAVLSKGLNIEIEVGQRFPNSKVVGWYALENWKTEEQLKAAAEEAIAARRKQAEKDGKSFEEDTSPDPIVPANDAPVAIRLTFQQN
jgi:hypothetical protein